MAFWTALEEPLRQYRWVLSFGNPNLSPVTFALKKAARPTVKISEVQHKYLNHFYYYPGRPEWEPISVTIASVVVNLKETVATYSNRSFFTALTEAGYIFPGTDGSTTTADRKTISKAEAVKALTNSAAKSSISISSLSANGSIYQTWYLFNPFFTDVKYDSLDYAADDIMNIDCTIKFDYATLSDSAGAELVG